MFVLFEYSLASYAMSVLSKAGRHLLSIRRAKRGMSAESMAEKVLLVIKTTGTK